MQRDFRIEINRDTDRAVIHVTGEVDLNTRDLLGAAATQSFDVAKTVVVDLTQVTFLDSAGLSALIRARNEADRLGCEFQIRSATGSVARVLEVTGLSHWLTAAEG